MTKKLVCRILCLWFMLPGIMLGAFSIAKMCAFHPSETILLALSVVLIYGAYYMYREGY